MYKWVGALAVAALLLSCGATGEENRATRALVYEGMSSKALQEVLGRPSRIDSSGWVLDVESGKKEILYEWHYDKRVVLIINDTVKNPALPLNR